MKGCNYLYLMLDIVCYKCFVSNLVPYLHHSYLFSNITYCKNTKWDVDWEQQIADTLIYVDDKTMNWDIILPAAQWSYQKDDFTSSTEKNSLSQGSWQVWNHLALVAQ